MWNQDAKLTLRNPSWEICKKNIYKQIIIQKLNFTKNVKIDVIKTSKHKIHKKSKNDGIF